MQGWPRRISQKAAKNLNYGDMHRFPLTISIRPLLWRARSRDHLRHFSNADDNASFAAFAAFERQMERQRQAEANSTSSGGLGPVQPLSATIIHSLFFPRLKLIKPFAVTSDATEGPRRVFSFLPATETYGTG